MKNLILLLLLAPSVGFSADYQKHFANLRGTDLGGNPCEINAYTTDYSDGVYALQSSMRKADGSYVHTNSVRILNDQLPLTAKVAQGDVCGSFGSTMDNKLVQKGNTWIVRQRGIEFLSNWIEETTYTFKNADFQPANLLSLEVRKGAAKLSGSGACKALDKGDVEAVFKCTVNQ